MGGKQLKVNLSEITGDPIKATTVTQKRLFYENGEIKFNPKVIYPDPSEVLVDVEETTVVSLEMPEPISVAGQIQREFWFAPETAVNHTELTNKEFTIDVDNVDEVNRCVMRVGLHREGGLKRKLEGTFNGKPFKLRVKWAAEMNHLFATIDVPIPIKYLKRSNTIVLKSHRGLTLTALHLSTDR
jgi:agarase